MKSFHPLLVGFVLGASVGAGCSRSDEPVVEAAPPAPAPVATEVPPAQPAVGPAPAEPPSDHADDPSYELRIAPAEGYAAGKVGSFAVTLKPRGEWHLNLDFPTQVSVSGAPALTFPSANIGKQAAAEFGEHFARFDVPFTASAPGSHSVTCDVKFAVCSEANCIPEERTLAVALRVD